MPYEEHRVFETPERSASLWRYTSLVKLLDVLTSESLFFARCDKLNDLHEGAIGRATFDLQRARLEEMRIAIGSPNMNADRIVESYTEMRVQQRKHVAVSCWHQADAESAAMWSLYGPSEGGVAIQTTVGRLADSFQDARPIFIGAVRYIDY
ncbi:MAG: hypothetical protein WCI61_07395, partial [Chloroflexota bacterium]